MMIGREFVHSVGFVWFGIWLALVGIWVALWWVIFN